MDRLLDFDRISIQEMSKENMLLIIEALEYTGKHSNMEDFLNLRTSILEELASLAEVDSNTFLEYLKR